MSTHQISIQSRVRNNDGNFWGGPYLRVLGVILFKVSTLCVIVTFHIATFDKGNCLIAIFATFRFLSGLKPSMIFGKEETDTVSKSNSLRCSE